MDFRRLRLIATAVACAAISYGVTNVALDQLARRMEVHQRAYLWWSEEWMQLFTSSNFVDRGKNRILLSGSSEGREGFVSDEIEAVLPGFEVYNNSYSRNTFAAFLLELQYMDMVYGPSAIPQKIVLGLTPEFAMNVPPIEDSYVPRVINRYSPYVGVRIFAGETPELRPKGWRGSARARFELLTHQSRRYQGAMRGVMRATVERLAPEFADRYWVRHKLVISTYHHLPPRDKAEELERARRAGGLYAADPNERAATLRAEWAALDAFVKEHQVALYVVSLPQSTWWKKPFDRDFSDEYKRVLLDVLEDTPFLDLSEFLRDDEFYDMTHATLASARRISERVARFVRETDEATGEQPRSTH